ncbi:ATP-dependent DNA ligase [Choiromyces venosus 120613-1]|uniref:DNA ligase n=1 Tax=Choiromyces venosus 120613-1 TaxID=1336337 RepID=A0A3N4J351_9PEZI|nr:ATP-dependent DNA ligase [Choiromyces venosus 120613-1]
MSDIDDIDLPDIPRAPVDPSGDALGPNRILSDFDLDREYPNRPRNKNPTLPFADLYLSLFEPLLANKKKKTGVGIRGTKALKPHEIRRNIIDRFISRWRNEVGNDIYPALRLILCEKDRDRSVYHLKEKTIGRLLVKVMKINKDSDDGYALINWKQPGASKSAGDFALRCYEIIKKRPMRTTPGNLTITQVNSMLDRLSLASKEEEQLPIMTEFYNNMNASELMWLIRIIMRQMKVGATERTFFDAWHPDAAALFNISSSLKRVCWELSDPEFRMDSDDKSVSLMSCFQPQLAQFQKRSLDDAVKAMHLTPEDPVFWIEEKLDGERMQMHYENGNFMFWSRKAKDYTRLYGSCFDDGSLTRHLRGAFDDGVQSIILDGEMITWDPRLDCIVAFGTLKTAALEGIRNPYGDGPRPLFRVFDILHLNGECLINYTLRDRRTALERSVKNVHRRMEIHEYEEAREAVEIERALRKVIDEASEGLVIKNPRSVYRLNDRNDDWMKVKPEYMTEFGESLDLLVLGGYWGSGSRGGILSSYLCGLRVDGNHLKPGENPMKFRSFCKVGGGFTANDYSKVAHMTDSQWVPWDPKKPPNEYIEIVSNGRGVDQPDVWIRPDKSIVLEVKAASIIPTDEFRAGKSLRFPRFRRIREDKDWQSALSISELIAFKEEVEKEKAEEEKRIEVENRKRRTGKRIKREYIVLGANDKPADFVSSAIEGCPQLFEGRSFYVMSDATIPKKMGKAEIEQLIKSHGGKIYQTENAVSCTNIIGDRNNVKISALKKKGTHDIIRPAWIFDCIRQHELDLQRGHKGCYIIPIEPRHILHASGSAERRATAALDQFGDSYARDLTMEELSKLLHDMPGTFDRTFAADFVKGLDELDQRELDELPGWMFKSLVIYVDMQDQGQANKNLKPPECLALFAGARIAQDLQDPDITHIVASSNRQRLQELRDMIKWRPRIPRIVTKDWLESSLEARTILDAERFLPVLSDDR